jgi:hypothetical protein
MTNLSALMTTPITPDLLFGALEIEATEAGFLLHRLPARARAQNDDPMLSMAEIQPSGVRLAFRTIATEIELETLPTKRAYLGMPQRPDGVYDLCIDGQLVQQERTPGGRVLRLDMASGSAELEPGEPQVVRFAGLAGVEKRVEIWLPHDEATELIALRSDAPLVPVARGERPVWLHHGSSISQGSNAASPTGIWPVVAARLAGVELVNLGFSGSALLDPFVARTIRDSEADMISLKIGINLVNTDLMRLRAFGPAIHGFLDTVREGHPETPLFVVSPVFCPIHETAPGPSQLDLVALKQGRALFRAADAVGGDIRGRLTLSLIREQLRAIVGKRAERDHNIHYLDGTALYGEADNARLPLPDELHPDAETHLMMGERFAELVLKRG